jgi:hypothetical protein
MTSLRNSESLDTPADVSNRFWKTWEKNSREPARGSQTPAHHYALNVESGPTPASNSKGSSLSRSPFTTVF